MADGPFPPSGYVREDGYYIITYVYIVFGSITLLLNVPLAVYLLKTIGRNQKELIVIIVLSMSDIICAGQFLAMGIYRFWIWDKDVIFVSQFTCNRNLIVGSFQVCIQMDNLFSLVIALDRLFAVLFPVKYNQCGQKYTALLVITPVITAVIGYSTHLIALRFVPAQYFDEICFNFMVILSAYWGYLSYQRMLCVFIPTLIYFFIYIRMKLKFQKIGNSNSALSKGMRHLTKTVAYITLASFFFVLIPEAWFYFSLFGGMDASVYFTFVLVKKIVTFFIHTIRHRELMKHVEKWLPKKLSSVIHFDFQSHSAISKVRPFKESTHQMTTTMR